jgi:hypothetical protein
MLSLYVTFLHYMDYTSQLGLQLYSKAKTNDIL